MSDFTSSFDKFAPYLLAVAGQGDESTWIQPDTIDKETLESLAVEYLGSEQAAVLLEAGLLDPLAECSVAFPEAAVQAVTDASSGSVTSSENWMYRSDITDMGVGGGPEGFYFIDGDSSYSIF